MNKWQLDLKANDTHLLSHHSIYDSNKIECEIINNKSKITLCWEVHNVKNSFCVWRLMEEYKDYHEWTILLRGHIHGDQLSQFELMPNVFRQKRKLKCQRCHVSIILYWQRMQDDFHICWIESMFIHWLCTMTKHDR